jgi:hypothetical protein
MSSDQLIALATDALRGLLQAALPADSVVLLGPPSPEGQEVSGVSLHLFCIGTNPAVRQAAPVARGDGAHLQPPFGLQLDYLISGLGGEAFEELGLLGAALQALVDSPVREGDSLAVLLSQPERLAAMSPGSLRLQWQVLDLPIDQVSGVWVASGMRMRGGMFCRAEASFRAVLAPGIKPTGDV